MTFGVFVFTILVNGQVYAVHCSKVLKNECLVTNQNGQTFIPDMMPDGKEVVKAIQLKRKNSK